MSIRHIGQQIYVPSSPGTFARGHTKTIRAATLPDETDQKKNKVAWYREELDRQVQQSQKRKQDQKKKEQEEDQRRERQFYSSLNNKDASSPIPNYHLSKGKGSHSRVRGESTDIKGEHDRFNVRQLDNPEDYYHYGDYLGGMEFASSRLAHIGVRKLAPVQVKAREQQMQIEYPNMYGENSNKYGENPSRYGSRWREKDEEYSQIKLQKRRKDFNEEMDRSLRDAFTVVDRSKMGVVEIDEELSKIRRKLKTETSCESRQEYYDGKMYCLPYKNHSNRNYR